MNAFDDIELLEGETIEAVVFGNFGDSYSVEPEDGGARGEVDPPIPKEFRKKILSFEEAYPHGEGWKFYSGFGTSETYNAHIWTNLRVLFVHEYDGSTYLESVPRSPTDSIMPTSH